MPTASTAAHPAANELPPDLKNLRIHISNRREVEAIRAARYSGDPSFSLEDLIEIACLKDDATLLSSEYLEVLIERIGWWMAAADIALFDQGPKRLDAEDHRVAEQLQQLRSLLPEVFAPIPAAWNETYLHQADRGLRILSGRRLVDRYLEFREAVCTSIEEIWASFEDRSIFQDMRRLG